MKHTLIWNGKTAEQMGLKIISLPPLQLSTERVKEKEVEGRDGTLTMTNGYTSDEKTLEVDYRGNSPMKIANWLQGSGRVIFGNLPDRYYKARINNVVPLEQVLLNQIYNFLVKFKCQPFGYLLEGDDPIELSSSGTIIYNGKATYDSLPLITIYGTTTGVLVVNDISYKITNIGGYISLDCDLEEVLEEKGEFFESDDFPILKVGENTISWSGGINKVVVVPRWRCK